MNILLLIAIYVLIFTALIPDPPRVPWWKTWDRIKTRKKEKS